ncbi:MAG: squalene--hopene cyclase [Bryobacterales bacterium]|nr:squalene--hopene cyclase [Bryobacterales bacterium]
MQKALRWLEAKQDRATGAWPAPSMNKVYEKDSIQAGFMTDMASGFAAAALASCAPGQ